MLALYKYFSNKTSFCHLQKLQTKNMDEFVNLINQCRLEYIFVSFSVHSAHKFIIAAPAKPLR